MGIKHRRERLEFEFDQLRGIFGDVAALRDDHGNRFADVTDLVIGEQRLLRVDEFMLHKACPFARQRQLRVGYGRKQLGKFGAAQHIDHAWQRGRAREIDRPDARMGERAAHERRMQHARQLEVGDELSASRQQAPILAARDGAADKGRGLRIVHFADFIAASSSSRRTFNPSHETHRMDWRQGVRHARPAVALVLAHPEASGGRSECQSVAGSVERQSMAVDHVIGV